MGATRSASPALPPTCECHNWPSAARRRPPGQNPAVTWLGSHVGGCRRGRTPRRTPTRRPASAPAGRPAMAEASARSALEMRASSRKAARAKANGSERPSASRPIITVLWAARAVATTAVAAAARTDSDRARRAAPVSGAGVHTGPPIVLGVWPVGRRRHRRHLPLERGRHRMPVGSGDVAQSRHPGDGQRRVSDPVDD